MEKIFYVVLACLFVGLLFYVRRLRLEARRLGRLKQVFYAASSTFGLLMVGYDARRDVATLSPDCARLFHLPKKVPHFSRTRQAAEQDPAHPLYPLYHCLGAFDADTPYSYLRRGEAPRRFLLRSFVLKDETARPYYVLGVFRDITQQANEEARLVARAQFDGLTRIHNSGATRSWMRDHIGRPRADGTRGGMLFLLDVDHFKGVNDTIGHQGGDRALICVANALRRTFAGRGFLGRLGGDEFIAYLDTNDAAEAEKLACAIHEHALRLGREAGLPLDLTVSIGCALLEDEDYEAAYQKADRALYAAKEQGRNTHVILRADGAAPKTERREAL
ncbi:MAG: diguanylate cyclase [Selenomonadaceae bacterium]|nr:diguanylate cyclase [Selenomonadaceae bacterium]MDY2685132.1 diguanylate cyclase [Selenomonadaceae bacterium]